MMYCLAKERGLNKNKRRVSRENMFGGFSWKARTLRCFEGKRASIQELKSTS